MARNNSKIYRYTSLIILAIIISSLLNICLFTFGAKAAPIQSPKLNFAYNNDGNCVAAPMPEPTEAINRPAAPMPECCLAQNRNFTAVVSVANDKSAPTFTGLAILPLDKLNPENNYTYYTSQLTYPPPAALALASIIIRE
jgi:hypothetical protein